MSEKTLEKKVNNNSSELKNFINANKVWFILIFLFLIMVVLTKGKFASITNIINIVQSEAGVGLLAIGVTFAIISGGIDLSLGSVVSLTSVIAGSLVQNITYAQKILPGVEPFPAVFALIVGLAVGAFVGATNGWLIAYTKIHPFIATLGSMSVCRGIALLYTNAKPVAQLTPEFTALGAKKISGNFTTIIVFFIAMALISWYLLNQTRFGRNVYAIGGNSNSARVAGVNIEKNLVLTYAWCSTCAALGGVLMAARAGAGNPALGLNRELDAIAAATVGGVSQRGGLGKISGALAGIFILGIVKSALIYLGVSSYYQDIVKGLIIVIAVVIDMKGERKSK